MIQMPFWRHVIFVDWHGVLSRDPFWMSIRESANHPLHSQLEANLSVVFSPNNSVGHEWMRGSLSSDELIATMNIQLDRRSREDFLARRLDVDCARMSVNVALFEVLRSLSSRAIVVLATDNTDSFARTFDQARQRRHRLSPESETLADWAIICDDIICSSNVQVLKSEDPAKFFGPWLSDRELSFTDSVLVDDRADNCEAFVSQGGAAVQWKMGRDSIEDVAKALDRWLDDRVRV